MVRYSCISIICILYSVYYYSVHIIISQFYSFNLNERDIKLKLCISKFALVYLNCADVTNAILCM